MVRKIILAILISCILGIGIYEGFIKTEEPIFSLAKVSRGNVVQEVSETGVVKKGEEINLSFKSSGRIEEIYVGVGDQVKSGENLVKLETTQLQIQLGEANANLDLTQAQLEKLLAGASPEEIQLAETAIDNAETTLESAQQNLKDVEASAEEDLKAAYEDALNTLDDSYLKADNASRVADLIQRSYFIQSDQEGIRVRDNKDKIEKAISQVGPYLDAAEADPEYSNIDTALSEMKVALEEIYSALRFIREVCEQPTYRSVVSSADKDSLDTQKTYINTALTNVTNSQQTISSTKLTNESDINTAKSAISEAEGALRLAQDELTLLLASPRQEDINLYQAQVNQAEAQVNLLENQIQEATLTSPVNGQITKINKRVGEMAQSTLQDAVITLLPADPFEIEVDIYEEDVVKINIGNPVEISLVPFPDKIFKGKVISIDPAEKIVEGVVYYETSIGFEEMPDNLKPGMTADLVIQAALKENVLVIPEDALHEKDDKRIVQVFQDGEAKDKEIEIGLIGSNDLIEVISGLEEGEEVILE